MAVEGDHVDGECHRHINGCLPAGSFGLPTGPVVLPAAAASQAPSAARSTASDEVVDGFPGAMRKLNSIIMEGLAADVGCRANNFFFSSTSTFSSFTSSSSFSSSSRHRGCRALQRKGGGNRCDISMDHGG